MRTPSEGGSAAKRLRTGEDTTPAFLLGSDGDNIEAPDGSDSPQEPGAQQAAPADGYNDAEMDLEADLAKVLEMDEGRDSDQEGGGHGVDGEASGVLPGEGNRPARGESGGSGEGRGAGSRRGGDGVGEEEDRGQELADGGRAARQGKERKIATLLKVMRDSELDRYEAYRRSNIQRPKMRKLMMSLSGQTVNDEKVLIVVCSLTKMFIGDLIEQAREIATGDGHRGALLRQHVHRAYRVLEREGKVRKRDAP